MKLTVQNPSVSMGVISFQLIGYPSLEGLDELDGPLTLEIKKKSNRRSMDANAYCWALLDRLSAVMQEPAVDIYRRTIREIGGVSKMISIEDDAVAEWMRIWSLRGIGWSCDVLDAAGQPGYTWIQCYFGSSTYTTGQMARLINAIVQDCKAVGIETATPQEIEAYINDWRAKP